MEKEGAIIVFYVILLLGIVGMGLSEVPNPIKLPMLICFFILIIYGNFAFSWRIDGNPVRTDY